MAPVVGFYSYAREDDVLTSGAVSQLHGLLEGRIRLRLPGFSLFQDQRDFEPGDVWAERLATLQFVSLREHGTGRSSLDYVPNQGKLLGSSRIIPSIRSKS